ncbi:UNVERIFIED_CONTAM: hypothetical protein HDU68_003177 [Siphonaria sp. JEL0065]|nr:hypothetical protein HDU68_003177 [Siphonaria sp. JEL0065]
MPLSTIIDIAYFGLLSGAATLDGGAWIADMNYSQSVNLHLSAPNFATLLAEKIMADQEDRISQASFAAQIAFISFLTDISEMAGNRVTSSALTVDGMVQVFAHAVVDIPDARPLVESLLLLSSFSIVPRVRKVIRLAMELIGKLNPGWELEFDQDGETFDPETAVVNNLQIPLKTTSEFWGQFFGYEFAKTFQRCFDDHSGDLLTDHVTENVQVIERFSKAFYQNGERVGERQVWDKVTDDGAYGLELYIEDIMNNHINVVATSFSSDGALTPVQAIAHEYKVSQIIFQMPEEQIEYLEN